MQTPAFRKSPARDATDESGDPMIHLFAGPVHTGKTTVLMNWIAHETGIDGFLCPDIGGKRMLYEISSGKYHPFQTDDASSPACIRTGQYLIHASAFDTAMEILDSALIRQPRVFVIDELGNLELRDGGFAGMIRKAVLAHRSQEFRSDLLIVVRDSCVKRAVEHFELQPHRIIQSLCFQPDSPRLFQDRL